ncbi:MAG: hypothetical protein U9R06_01765 [Patescibacteria group bacterium]|nr:hypothetical protein [Patescibacteria group bacterium]
MGLAKSASGGIKLKNINLVLERVRFNGGFMEDFLTILEDFIYDIIPKSRDIEEKDKSAMIAEFELMNYRTEKVQNKENLFGAFKDKFIFFCLALTLCESIKDQREKDSQIKSIVMIFKFIGYYYQKTYYTH